MTKIFNGVVSAATLETEATAALAELTNAETALTQLRNGLNSQQIDGWDLRIQQLRASYADRFGPPPG